MIEDQDQEETEAAESDADGDEEIAPDLSTYQGQLARSLMEIERGDLVRFPKGEETAAVWLAQDADDFGRMHEVVVLQRGGQSQVFELSGWEESKPVQRLLAAAGFVKSAPLGLRARRVEDGRPLVPIMGFEVPVSEVPEVESKIRDALEGKLGGFSEVVLSQTGFHRAPVVFETAWHAAGCPPVKVRHPAWVENNEEATSATIPLLPVAEANPTLSAILAWERSQS